MFNKVLTYLLTYTFGDSVV